MEYEHRYQQQVPEPKYECLLFDVDDTLYPLSSGLSEQCSKNIIEYMTNKLGMEGTDVPDLNLQLYKDYGTTMAGLRALGYDFDYDDYHSFVHGRLPYEILKPDPVLRKLLHSLPIRKVIFSNANEAHVGKVLACLGLEDCFDGIICFETLNPADGTNIADATKSSTVVTIGSSEDSSELPKSPVVCKPNEDAFEQACALAEIDPKRTLFFDDSIRNLQTANRVGFHTMLVGSSHRPKGVDYAVESIHNIREALPVLWEDLEKANAVRYAEKIAIETSVRA